MTDTQTFVWRTEEEMDSLLEVRHSKFEMLLNVTANVAEKIRAKMAELNESGMYPNEETTKEVGLFAQFIISGGYNWNSRWCDFKTILDETLGIHGEEFEWYDDKTMEPPLDPEAPKRNPELDAIWKAMGGN